MRSSQGEDADLATTLVQEAAALAADIRAEGLDVATKSSGSDVVTQADLAAERLIFDRLTRERPDDGILW